MIQNKFKYEYVSYKELYEAYLDCRKRKRTTDNALDFEINDNLKLYYLWIDLNNLNYEIGKSIAFCVDKPVKREVFAADFIDRIVHHLLINRINETIEKEFIDDSYSCRVGKGTDYGIKKCQQYIVEATLNYTKDCYIIKCDLKSFFMTIDKEKLKQKLFKFIDEKYFKDRKNCQYVKYLIDIIVSHEPQNNCIRKQDISHWKGLPKEKSLFSCEKGKGLPIGNLTSQIFANFYLSDFDKFVKETLLIPYYGRYVDDFFIIVESKQEAEYVLGACRNYLRKLGVNLHPNKLYIQHIDKGVKFIGAVVKDNRVYISNRTKGNFYWKIININKYIEQQKKEHKKLTLTEIEYIISSLNSYLGFLKQYKTYNIRKKILLDYKLMKEIYKFCYPNLSLTKVTLFKEYCKYPSKKKKRVTRDEFFRKGMHRKIKEANTKVNKDDI